MRQVTLGDAGGIPAIARSVLLLLVVLASLAASRRAIAHPTGVSQGSYVFAGGSVTALSIFRLPDLVAAVPALDLDHDGRLSPAELLTSSASDMPVHHELAALMAVSTDAGVCLVKPPVRLSRDDDGAQIQALYTCPVTASRLVFDFTMLERLPTEHRHLGSFRIDQVLMQQLVSRASPRATFPVTSAAVATQALVQPVVHSFGGFMRMGAEHVLAGYDHMAFLLGLVLVSNRLRALIVLVTAFTFGHSLALLMAAFEVWVPGSTWVELAIALSIVYVALENVVAFQSGEMPVGRWRLTLPFGVVHGFGFASALHVVEVESRSLLRVLGGFNLGVELGQLALLALFWCVLHVLRKVPLFARCGPLLLSVMLAAAGMFWFAVRVAAT